jgi:hypothetical protein
MLRDGKFIKEDPPKIGAYYVPRFKLEEYTPEERFVQSLVLDYQDRSTSFFSKFLGVMLRV